MKIAILQSGDLENLALGGIDQYIKNIIRNRGNNDVVVYGTCVHGKYEIGKKYEIKKGDLEYSFFPISDDSVKPLTKGYLINEPRFINTICECDIIYAQRMELTIPFLFCKKARKKLVQVIHGSSYYSTLHMGAVKSRVYLLAERLSIAIAKKTYVVLMRDEFGVPYYKRKYKRFSSRIEYTKIPVNTQIFKHSDKKQCRSELNLPMDKFLIMYGGRVENNPKRVFLFPEILKCLNEKYNVYHLIVVGEGGDLHDLKELLAKECTPESYTIVGYLEDRRSFAKYICSSDVNLNISEFEGTCTSSLEAVACGCPVVSTDVGDIRLFVDKGENGLIIPNSQNRRKLIQLSVEAISDVNEDKVVMTNEYMKYECSSAINELFLQFHKIITEIE